MPVSLEAVAGETQGDEAQDEVQNDAQDEAQDETQLEPPDEAQAMPLAEPPEELVQEPVTPAPKRRGRPSKAKGAGADASCRSQAGRTARTQALTATTTLGF